MRFLGSCFEQLGDGVGGLVFTLLVFSPLFAIGFYMRANDLEESLKTVCGSHTQMIQTLKTDSYIQLLDAPTLELATINTPEGARISTVLTSKWNIEAECGYLMAK